MGIWGSDVYWAPLKLAVLAWTAVNAEDLVSGGGILWNCTRYYPQAVMKYARFSSEGDVLSTRQGNIKMVIASVALFGEPKRWGGDLTMLMASQALLRNYGSGIPPRAIRALTGRGSNRSSLRATSPCAKSFLAGRQPYQPTCCRVFPRTSAPPSRRFRSLLAKAGYTPPTTASSCSSGNRLRTPRPTCSAQWGARLFFKR